MNIQPLVSISIFNTFDPFLFLVPLKSISIFAIGLIYPLALLNSILSLLKYLESLKIK